MKIKIVLQNIIDIKIFAVVVIKEYTLYTRIADTIASNIPKGKACFQFLLTAYQKSFHTKTGSPETRLRTMYAVPTLTSPNVKRVNAPIAKNTYVSGVGV